MDHGKKELYIDEMMTMSAMCTLSWICI